MTTSPAVLTIRHHLNTYGGPETGTEYDLSDACTSCGTGAAQVGPLRLRLRRPPKHDIWLTLDHEIVVSEALAESLISRGCNCLEQVVASRTSVPLPLWQLRPQATLPRFSPATSGVVRERPCPACDRDGYFGIPHVPTRLVYVEGIQLQHQLLVTFERFGNSRLRSPFRKSVFAAPLHVATSQLLEALLHAQPHGLELEPITVS